MDRKELINVGLIVRLPIMQLIALACGLQVAIRMHALLIRTDGIL